MAWTIIISANDESQAQIGFFVTQKCCLIVCKERYFGVLYTHFALCDTGETKIQVLFKNCLFINHSTHECGVVLGCLKRQGHKQGQFSYELRDLLQLGTSFPSFPFFLLRSAHITSFFWTWKHDFQISARKAHWIAFYMSVVVFIKCKMYLSYITKGKKSKEQLKYWLIVLSFCLINNN